MGVIQGWSPGSMAQAALRLKKMGYYVAVGGMVPLRTPQIKTALQAIRELIGNEIQMHILGFAKVDQINEFKDYNITSFDSTSPLIRAFKDSNRNYYVSEADGTMSYYSAIGIPQALDNRTLKDLAKRGKFSQEDFIQRERFALDAIRAFDAGTVDLEEALEVIMAYSGPLLIGKDEYLNEKDIRKRDTLEARYRETLQEEAVEVMQLCNLPRRGCRAIIFRGGNRNRRRGFHNLEVYHQHLKEDRVMTNKIKFTGIAARQSNKHTVVSFPALASDVFAVAKIDRAGRTDQGELFGVSETFKSQQFKN